MCTVKNNTSEMGDVSNGSYQLVIETHLLPSSCARKTGSGVLGFFKLCVVLLLCVAAGVNLYLAVRLSPLIHNINSVVDKATVLYDVIYYYGCNLTQFLPANECDILKRLV